MSATSPSDLRSHLESPPQFKSLLDDEETKDRKPRNLDFSIGVSNTGLNLELLKKNIVKQGDSFKLLYNMNQHKE
jgi:hypothetical protein